MSSASVSAPPLSNTAPVSGRDRRVAAILAGARRLFLEHGFERTTMDAIAAEAKVSKATLYVYWDDKLTLFRSLIAQEIAKTNAALAGMTHLRDAPIGDRLFEAGMQFVRLVTAPPFLALMRVVIAEGRNHPALGTAVRRLCTPPPDSAFAALIKEGHPASLDPHEQRRRLELFMGMMLGTLQIQLLLDPECTIDASETAAHVRYATNAFLATQRPIEELANHSTKPYGLVSRRAFKHDQDRR